MSENMLKLTNIRKDFFIESKKIEVLKSVNLELGVGEMISLTGKSGAGKSTLINIIATIERPDGGEVLIKGENIMKMGDSKMSRFRNREIGIVFQFHHLLPEFTALENVAMPLMIAGKMNESLNEAREMLKRVGLEKRLEHKPAELSGGEQQRVAVARALVTSPSLLLLDEPTGNLDEDTGTVILKLIMDLAREKALTTIFVTHNKSFARRMEKTYDLKHGELCLLKD